MNRKFAIIAAALAATTTLADGPKFTGYVTATYGHDFADTASGNSYYGNSQGNGFLLNAAHLTIVGGDSAGATYGIDLDAGTDGTHNVGGLSVGSGWALDVQQAFLTIPVFKSPLSVTAGKFYTSEGIEVLNSGASPTITRGLLFSYLEPLAHTGALLTYKVSDAVSVSLGGVNGFDNWTVSDADGIPTVYAKVALGFGNPFSGTVSAYYGPQANIYPFNNGREKFLSLDLTGLNKSVDNLAINFQVNYLKKDKYNADDATNSQNLGVGIQPIYTIGAAQIGARYEFASLDLHDVQFDNTTIHSFSVAPGYKPTQNSLARVEYRIDLASGKIFGKSDDKKKNDQIVTAELNYTF